MQVDFSSEPIADIETCIQDYEEYMNIMELNYKCIQGHLE